MPCFCVSSLRRWVEGPVYLCQRGEGAAATIGGTDLSTVRLALAGPEGSNLSPDKNSSEALCSAHSGRRHCLRRILSRLWLPFPAGRFLPAERACLSCVASLISVPGCASSDQKSSALSMCASCRCLSHSKGVWKSCPGTLSCVVCLAVSKEIFCSLCHALWDLSRTHLPDAGGWVDRRGV